MNAHYVYTPYLWPILLSAGIMLSVAAYAWRRSSTPGATPFAVLIALAVPWLLGAGMEMATVDVPTRIFWIKFQSVWQIPAATAGLWFALEYANLTRWLTRRTFALLSIPPLLFLLLVLTDNAYHVIWTGIAPGTYPHLLHATGGWVAMVYGHLVGWITPLVFVWLFIASPMHRSSAALILCGQIVARAAYYMDLFQVRAFGPVDAVVPGFLVLSTMYGLALFRFHLFDLVSVARETVIEQMEEGILVLSTEGRVLDLNPVGERLLGASRSQVIGREAAEVPSLIEKSAVSAGRSVEMVWGVEPAQRFYEVSSSKLTTRRGFHIGWLVLFHDVTELRQARQDLLRKQTAQSAARERDLVARELHDGLGQVLGFAKMQATAARAMIAQERSADADGYLGQLIAATQDAHADVREYILSARAGTEAAPGLLAALRRYLPRFSESYGIQTELQVAPEVSDTLFEPAVEMQLLCIIQEALTNARKHANAHLAKVSFHRESNWARVMVEDDGAGFDPAEPASEKTLSFGLRFMRERAAEVGGCVELRSAPGQGTQVIVEVPIVKAMRAATGKG